MAAPADKRPADKGARESSAKRLPQVRAWVFRDNGDVDVIRTASAKMTSVVNAFEPMLRATSSESGHCNVEFLTFPRRKSGHWALILDETGRYTQPQNVGFASYVFDLSSTAAFNGPVALACCPSDDDDVDLDHAAVLDDLPPRPSPADLGDDDDPEDAYNAVLEKFFKELRADWTRYRQNRAQS